MFLLPPATCLLPPWFLVGVGIEPTFRAFQTRANPSQLSDPGHCQSPIFDCRFEGLLAFNRQLAFGNRQ